MEINPGVETIVFIKKAQTQGSVKGINHAGLNKTLVSSMCRIYSWIKLSK